MKLRALVLMLALATVGLTAQSRPTYEALTVANTAVFISASITNPTGLPARSWCEGVLETAQVRFRDDGTAPTSSEGTPLNPGDVLPMSIPYARQIQFIRTGSTSGVLHVRCYE